MRSLSRVALIVACAAGCDGGGGTNGGADAAPDVAIDSSTAGHTLFTGTACGQPVSYTLGGDERITVIRDASGALEGLTLLDGPLFDQEDEMAWQTYAAQHDTYLLIAFDDPEPATAHRVTAIFDSAFGGRGTGVIGFVEHGMGEIVDILALDVDARTISVEFTIGVYAHAPGYPPDFTTLVDCQMGSITGSFSGPFELATF